MKFLRIIGFTIAITFLISGTVAYMEPDTKQETKPAIEFMKMVAENENLALYINEETTEIAVKDKVTNVAWYSNPEFRNSDSRAASLNKDKLSSQISISYFTSTAQQKFMNNYTDSIKYGQFDIEAIENGVRVNYRIGKEEQIYVLPTVISQTRMEEKILSKIEETKRRSFIRNYRTFSLENAKNDEQRSELLLQYPSLENGDLYVLVDNIRDFLKKDLEELVVSTGYTLEDMNDDHLTNNVPVLEANLEIFKIPLEYTLDGDNLVATIPTQDIEYNHDIYPINKLQLLEFFGAAGEDEEGYILVPDGSGSLIYLNNNKLGSEAYAIDVYGSDRSIPLTERTSLIEQSYLPVFGMKRGDNAFFSIIESGSALARIWADISGRQNSYNTAYSEYTLIPTDQLDIGDYSGNSTIMVFQPRIFKSDIKVRYSFLYGDNANYSGMAEYYRQYLVKQYGLTRIKPKESVPFYLEVIGAINRVRSILGIPVTTTQSLTSYEEAIDIMKLLTDGNVKNIVLKFTGWANGGVDHTVPSKVKLISKLGGSTGFKKLQTYLDEKGFEFFPEFALMYAYKDTLFDGFTPRIHASRYITKLVATVFKFNLTTNMEDMSRGAFYVISPSRIPAIINGMMKGLSKLSIRGVALRDAAVDVNSDFRENQLVDRQEAVDIVASELKKMQDSGLSILVDGGNEYSLPFVDHVLNISEKSNQFHITDESIPFIQMVIRGYIDYAGKPINMSPDYRQAFLKSIETGSGIYFSFMYEENSVVKQTFYDHYYSNDYSVWLDEALDFYQQANTALGDVQGQTIVNHQKMKDNVFKTTFENGKEIVVNYNREPVTIDDNTIEALDFKVVKEGK